MVVVHSGKDHEWRRGFGPRLCSCFESLMKLVVIIMFTMAGQVLSTPLERTPHEYAIEVAGPGCFWEHRCHGPIGEQPFATPSPSRRTRRMRTSGFAVIPRPLLIAAVTFASPPPPPPTPAYAKLHVISRRLFIAAHPPGSPPAQRRARLSVLFEQARRAAKGAARKPAQV
jgi:hypothetical protein